MGLVILAGVCLLAQIVLAIGWLTTSKALRAWATSIQKGWQKESVDSLRERMPLMSNVLQQNVVPWKGRAHLKEASAVWLIRSKIEEDHGSSISVLYGLFGGVLLTTLAQFIGTSETASWVEPTLLALVCLSLGLTLFINQSLTTSITKARLALDAVCPPLPSADNVTRDVMEQLQKQMKLLRNGQQQSLDSLGKSQATLAKLGTNLQLAFQKSVREQLAPALEEMSTLASASQRVNQRYVEETTRKQNQVVQGLIVQVMDGIDQAIGKSLRDTSESFAASVQRQQVSMDRWRRSVESVAEVIGSLEQTTKGVTVGAERMAQAAEPVRAAAQVFSDSAKELQKVFPVVSQLGEMVLQAQSGLTESHSAIQRGTAEYLEVTGTIRTMVSDLNRAHESSIERISGSVEETLVQPFAHMTSELQTLQTGQRTAFDQLQQMTASIEQTLKQLEGGHDNLSTLAAQIQKAGEPSVQAAASFVLVSQQLQQIVPQLENTTQIHKVGAQTMQRISEGLQSENNRNEQMLEQVQALLEQLESTQQQMAERVAKGVDGALAEKLVEARENFVADVRAASDALKQSGVGAAQQFQESSALLVTQIEASGESWTGTIASTSEQWTEIMSNSVELLTQTTGQWALQVETSGGKWSETVGRAANEAGRDWKQANVEAATQLQTVGANLLNTLDEQSTKLVKTLDNSTLSFAKQMSLSSTEVAEHLKQSSIELSQTLQTARTEWDTQIRSSSQYISDSLKKSGSDINVSLSQVRQQLADTMSDSTKVLQQSLHTAGQTFIQDWGHMGQSIRDALEHASQSLDQSVQEVGRKLNQRIDEAGQSLELSVQQSAQSLQAGATHAHDKLSQVGDGWSTAIQDAANSLRGNAEFVSETISSTLSAVQSEMEEHLGRTLQSVETQMTKRLDEGIARQQQLIELSNIQQGKATQYLSEVTQQSTELLNKTIQDTQVALQSKLSDFGTDLQVSLQEIFQQYQNGLLSAARQQELAGQSLLDQAQEAGQKLQQAMSQAQVQTQNSLENMGTDMVLHLGQIHRQYSESLERSQASMSQLVSLQEGHIGSWQELVQTLTPALSQLNGSAVQLDQVVNNLKDSMTPATTVSENFKQASTQLQAVFPNISDTADSYHRFNQSLQEASSALAFTADKYSKAGGDMGGLLSQIEQSLDLQNQSNDSVSTTLQGVENTINNLEPVVRLMQQASHDIRVVSEGSTNTVETMKQATESQNQSVQQMGQLSAQLLKTLSGQSARLLELTGQMEQMQQVLTVGVDAFAHQLPQSVDGTLVQFDAVLAEGVLRINGSIERLREAMDDLIEQLER